MNVIDEAGILLTLGRWALAQARHDTGRPSPVPDNSKFMSARDAVALIDDDAVVAASGLGAHQRASILYWALRDRFAQSGHPRHLTLVNIGGHGGRGLLPGTLDELARPGLCTRFVTSHFETFHAFLALAAAGNCTLHTVPLGVLALLYDGLRRGKNTLLTATGVGTFLDPRTWRYYGRKPGKHEPLVALEHGQLRYHVPAIDVAIFNLPAADRRGNLYVKNSAMIGDSYELAHAAKRNGGIVIANVGLLVDEGYDRIFLPANMVDAIVCDPNTEQTAGFFHSNPWDAITTDGAGHIETALGHARLIRHLGAMVGGMARRTVVDDALYRLAAAALTSTVRKGGTVAIGTGHPEEVARVVFEHGKLKDITFLIETGVIGGLPAPGAYFGAAFSPREMVSTATLFKRCNRRLDGACLGALEVDSRGNVNVSRRGPGIRNYVGPGGFIDFTEAARTIIFVSGWMRNGEIIATDGVMSVQRQGKPKFVTRVSEVTFNGTQALRAGKTVVYVTPVGLFQLTERGVVLIGVMPGIDVRKDILGRTPMRIALPPSGEPQLLSPAIVSGSGFALSPRRLQLNLLPTRSGRPMPRARPAIGGRR